MRNEKMHKIPSVFARFVSVVCSVRCFFSSILLAVGVTPSVNVRNFGDVDCVVCSRVCVVWKAAALIWRFIFN